jgi:DNA topoisomerase-1
LYEKGLITYMRTDNNKYSKQFVDSITRYVSGTHDGPSMRPDIDRLLERSKSAHEAIRPTNILTVEPKSTTDRNLYRLYKLIWSNSLMSCLEPAVMDVLPTKISAPNGTWYEYNAERPIRLGWTKFQTNKSVSCDGSIYSYLSRLPQSSVIQYKQITTAVCLDRPISRYSESSLVRMLETEGIGRPSTFASIIEKLQTRQYASNQGIPGTDVEVLEYRLEDSVITPQRSSKRVGVEKNKLVIQPTGMVVSQFLYKHFEPIFNIGYTRQTELELDAIVRGEADWIAVCVQNNTIINSLLKAVKTSNVSKFGIAVDDANTFIIAKYGPVVKHTDSNGDVSFLPVNSNVNIDDIQSGACKLEDILKPVNTGGSVEPTNSHLFGVYDGKEIVVKKGRYGRYIVWGDTTKSIRCFGNRDILNVKMEEMVRVLTEPPKRRKKAKV